MESKFVKFTKPVFAILILALCILPMFVTADSSLGFIEQDGNYWSFGGSNDAIFDSQKSRWTVTGLDDGDTASVYIPDYGVAQGGNNPAIILNKPCNYDVVYTVYDPISADSVTINYSSNGLTIYPIRDFAQYVNTNKYIHDIQVDIYSTPGDYTELLGVWEFYGQWVLDTYAFSSAPTTYGSFTVGGSFEYGGGFYEFDSLRWSYVANGDKVNLVADTLDQGSFDLIVANEIIVPQISIDDAPLGEPGRLTSFLIDNAFNSAAQGLSISVGGLEPDTYSNGFADFAYSLKTVILNLKAQIETDVGDFFSWIVPSLDSFFAFEIGSISLGGVFGAILAISLLVALLKLFVGG